jgi:hypothetical protein
MVGKIFEAEVAGAKRLLLRRFLKAAQITLLLLNILTIGFMMASGIYNARASDQYMQYAATTGDDVAILNSANDSNNMANTHEGVSDPIYRRHHLSASNITFPSAACILSGSHHLCNSSGRVRCLRRVCVAHAEARAAAVG